MLAAKMAGLLRVGPVLLAATLTLAMTQAASAEPTESGKPATGAAKGERLEEARQHFETALEHYAKGRYRQAIIELRRAHALDPSGKDLLYNLAVVHEKLGEVGPALSYYRTVYELEPDGPSARCSSGSV